MGDDDEEAPKSPHAKKEKPGALTGPQMQADGFMAHPPSLLYK